MVQEEHRIFYDGGEATRESLKKVKPDKAPNRGLGIAELEKLRREEWQKGFSPGELVFHPLNPQQNTIVPFLPGFDPSFPFGYNVENFPMLRSHLLDSSPLVSSDGTMPLLWSSFQSDNSSSSNSQFSLATSELKPPPRESQPLLILQKPEPHQQISQVVNYSSLHSVPEAGLQMELELPSNQSYYGILTPSSWADQQLMMHQIVAMNHPWQNQRVSVAEPIPISHPDCGTMRINGTQGTSTDCSIDTALSLHNVGVNLNSNHPTMKRNVASEEDIAAPIEGSALSLVCLHPISSNGWSSKSVSVRPFSEMSATKRQKKTKESAGRKASATPSDALVFYNFMELPYSDYVAERDVIVNKKKRRWEGSEAVDVDLKL
ncbi:uncharacterized protein LOC110108544 isoform X1 [Dendrobium catenatum]|uniref:Uncharacterized protein n=1 Tax=Dendrobium catenatum TaxID=906689 RepID=A0A2I0X9E9_9ASPA|nr:uncharacterized protein LOC110108544 isoform X1 [Dendrobium catenatum]PKU84526.1 hypothetical protein MA16_Dca003039 [Dendrobium catenatum]